MPGQSRCRHSIAVAISGMLVPFMAGCEPALPPEATIPGPETSNLASGVTGYIVIGQLSGGITAVHLPDLVETVIRPPLPDDMGDSPTIHALSGPDADGRIAYIEDHYFVADERNQRHLLKTIKIDGTQDAELFTRPGDAMWAKSGIGTGRIGHHLALSPARGQVALVTYLAPVQMPRSLLHVGTIEIWDLQTKKGRETRIKAVDEGLAWFPDGRRLAYVKLAVPPRFAMSDEEVTSFGEGTEEWGAVPSVYVHDVDADTDSFLHVGYRPVVAADGKSVLVANLTNERRLVDAATRKSEVVTWPGGASAPVAIPAKEMVISWGLPTVGSKVKYSENNREMLLTLKIARFSSTEFQTVVPYIGRFSPVSFGQIQSGVLR
jgi:hypothetical protein